MVPGYHYIFLCYILPIILQKMEKILRYVVQNVDTMSGPLKYARTHYNTAPRCKVSSASCCDVWRPVPWGPAGARSRGAWRAGTATWWCRIDRRADRSRLEEREGPLQLLHSWQGTNGTRLNWFRASDHSVLIKANRNRRRYTRDFRVFLHLEVKMQAFSRMKMCPDYLESDVQFNNNHLILSEIKLIHLKSRSVEMLFIYVYIIRLNALEEEKKNRRHTLKWKPENSSNGVPLILHHLTRSVWWWRLLPRVVVVFPSRGNQFYGEIVTSLVCSHAASLRSHFNLWIE